MGLLQKGFSLIELMVVVAIIGIIASIAYPSYQGYTCDTYRGQAVADLKLCALAMERHYSNGFTYVGATVTALAGATCKNRSPAEGVKKFDLTTVTTANSYTLTATPATGHGCSVDTFKTLTLTADGTLTDG